MGIDFGCFLLQNDTEFMGVDSLQLTVCSQIQVF